MSDINKSSEEFKQQFVEIEGSYIQSPDKTEFDGYDPLTKKGRENLKNVYLERSENYNKELDITWTFRIKGTNTITRTKPEAKHINRYDKIELNDKQYIVLQRTSLQITSSRIDIEHLLEEYDENKHEWIDKREKY